MPSCYLSHLPPWHKTPPRRSSPPGVNKKQEHSSVKELGDRDARELVQAVVITRLSRRMALDEEQTILIMRRFSEYRDQSVQLQKKRLESVKKFNRAIKKEASDAEVSALLEEIVAFDRKLTSVKYDTLVQGGSGLDARQSAQLYVLLGEIENDIRRLIQQARKRAASSDRQEPCEGHGTRDDRRGGSAPSKAPIRPNASVSANKAE